MSVIVVATILPLPEFRDEVIALFEQTIAAVHDEPGCELYSLHTGEDRLVMIEKWESSEALDVHSHAEALQKLGPALAGKLSGRLDVQVLTAHPAGDPAKGAL